MEKMEQMYAELFEAAGAGRRQGEAMAAQAGQTQARWQVMWIVATGDLTVPQVARRLGISRQGVQRVASELSADGMLEFVDNPDHKTSPLLRLTERGRASLAEINGVADLTHKRMLEHFSEVDVDTLRDLLQRLVTTIKAVDEELRA